ncbi:MULTISPECIES: aminotransferase class I/II-fold pyridoxal phosphate-dependent enzyme [unclassified Dolichospermum]|uniref:aminotransferase class I/II-fold pyridoxal phosphate-dependent enzyme n=1 Tax=unclassified Dolichospermum TaxID=2622029 RepID=UPI001444E2C4|nr:MULTISPECIES: aminotransferase class I/II-fold pyridoxal phosphate-dependent enzyme [unclassified Dolichospermum]MTJ15847.1 aminotransferase class I/II-fold pyridoxal phosphate-dependent enzyme [Dolichospermum sp. UHCC 0299]MTJ41616.1 aminotransferase class I/II-fold pyridoxal phosphate-dependent enzyme [Dolichospermum sp. UHCC 0406]
MSVLAINGGKPEIEKQYRLFKHPRIDSDTQDAVLAQLDKTISLYGNEGIYEAIENALKKMWSLKYALTVNSGTNALYSMYIASGIRPGDKVLVPAYTFFATGTPLLRIGAIPILVDSLENGNLCPHAFANRLKEIDYDAKAVVMTHMWGIPCEISDIIEIASEHDILVLEDVSHAHGASFDNKVLGSFSDGAAWSFQGKKILTSGEGGLYATKHKFFFEQAVLLGHFNIRAREDVTTEELLDFRRTGTGFNMRMHVLGGAVLFNQLSNFDTQLRHRRETAEYMSNEVRKIEGLRLPSIPRNSKPAWYAFPVLYDPSYFGGVTKEKFVNALIKEGAIDADIPGSTCPLTEHKIFTQPGLIAYPYSETQLEQIQFLNSTNYRNAKAFHNHLFKLPTFYGEDRMKYARAYMNALRKVANNIGEIT